MAGNHNLFSPEEKLEILTYAKNHGVKSTAKKYFCSEQTVYRWKRRFDGSIKSLEENSSRPHTPHPRSHTIEEIKCIKEVLSNNPNISHKALYEILKNKYGYTRNPQGLYNFLRRNDIFHKPQLKGDYATMFDQEGVDRLNDRFLYSDNLTFPFYLIELDELKIYLAKKTVNNACFFTVYYATALRFYDQIEAIEFVKNLNNKSNRKLKIKRVEQIKKK